MTWLVHRILTMRGWRFVGRLPDHPKMIIIGAPHTSNWDFFLFLGFLHAFKMKARYMAKDGLFRWPFGHFFRAIGGIPVSQTRPGGVVGQVVEAFNRSDRMILVLAPEGTRSAAPEWKSGFLHIAREAGVPVVLVSVDGRVKEVEIGPALVYDGDVAGFMDQVRAFYGSKPGIKPRGLGPIVVAEES